MKNAQMLYKCPGPHRTDGIDYDYVIVDDDEVEAKLAEGWFSHYTEAYDAKLEAEITANEVTIGEMEQQLQDAPKLTAVHKGAGKWSLVNAAGAEVESGLTKADAKARATA